MVLVKNNIGIPFYEPGYIPVKDQIREKSVDYTNPKKIYEYLCGEVYKQDEYCKDAAMILYNHARGITSRNIVCGPAGCGKTLVWQCLKKIWPRILFVDSSTLTKTGWKGNNNISDFLTRVDAKHPDYIIVFDEFDKCVASQTNSGGENVSTALQSEFLKIVEGAEIPVKIDACERMVDTSRMSFVFCGSFALKAEEIGKENSSSGFGFGMERHEEKAFARELTMQDVISYGVIPELASRTTRIINVRPLTEEDYQYLITKHSASPVKKLEQTYGMKLRFSKKKIEEIARNAYESGLGIRSVTAQLMQIMDHKIFESFEDDTETAEVKNHRQKNHKDKKGERYVL